MSMQSTGKRIACSLTWVALASGLGANPFFVNAQIQPDSTASGWLEAPGHAGVILLRDGIPGEWAFQEAGPWPNDPRRVFAPLNQAAYYLTDAGSQWATSVASNQVLRGIVEVMTGEHGWQGPAFAGSSQMLVQKSMLTRSSLTLPDAILAQIPAPLLITSSASALLLSLPRFESYDASVSSLALWRRAAGSTAWQWLTDISNASPGNTTPWTDGNVVENQMYEYSLTVNYAWAGGGGAGSRPEQAGSYSTLARSLSQAMQASWLQPTPSPQAQPSPAILPADKQWMAYPNPLRGSLLQVVFRVPTSGQGRYHLQAFDLLGAKVAEWRGSTQKSGELRLQQDIKQLSSGIYLLKLEWNSQDNFEKSDFGVSKIAVIK